MLTSAALLLSFSGPAPDTGVLLARPTTTLTKLWEGGSEGTAHHATVFAHQPAAGWSALSDYAQPGHGPAGASFNWRRPHGPPLAVSSYEASKIASHLALILESLGMSSGTRLG